MGMYSPYRSPPKANNHEPTSFDEHLALDDSSLSFDGQQVSDCGEGARLLLVVLLLVII